MEGTVIAVGPGGRTSEGKVLPMALKAGDKVILPNYGGTEVKLDDKELIMYSEDEILGKLE
jgi:chaperonin GroES